MGENDQQQQNVDAYLEFLDRRYKRLHSNDRVTEDPKSKNPVPFSAMSWLMNGKDDAFVTKQQSEDALYVLGVAGLASQKLLQKHHLQTTGKEETVATLPSSDAHSRSHPHQSIDMDVIEVIAEANTPTNLLVRKFLVPFVRAIYVIQRRKQLILQGMQDKVKAFGAKAIQKVIYPTVRKLKNPGSIVNGLLELGGGKQNVMVTMTFTFAAILLLQPILRAAVADASVRA